ncbi:response regulator transcription factor [Hymenobacter taeanensis]|uniref:Response regulator transcription factor n=1 Tax=Hymenobacter taeanensis TaxID=2735321 RepID=A0A6M6BHV1_9BACT|nr:MULTISPECIES: LuxR C-terminal-related transcriptional regulator [Hymenobacter]QJX47374.1 response regulator transcription factor [Hymenobacter taeanensis]UOQ79286.1 LuxR C-terminal-related transcriptional regulator [Hymenobacter sp. 5414T-23]
MFRLRTTDFLRLNQAIALVYTELEPTTLFGRLSEAAARATRAETARFNGDNPDGLIGHLGAFPEARFLALPSPSLAAHLPNHPLFPTIMGQNYAQPLRSTTVAPLSSSTSTALHKEFYRPLAITHQLVVGLPVMHYGKIICAVTRSHRDFTATDKTLLQLLVPHFQAAVRLSQTLHALRQQVPPVAPPATPELTPRESVILGHLMRGLPDKEISRVCGISPRTVQNHLQNIYAKLEVDNRTAALCRVLGMAG